MIFSENKSMMSWNTDGWTLASGAPLHSTMSVSDVQAVLSTVRWTDEALYLKEFVHKQQLPQIAKVLT